MKWDRSRECCFTSLLQKQSTVADKLKYPNYEVCCLLACQMKPFKDGDFIKECIIVVIDLLS